VPGELLLPRDQDRLLVGEFAAAVAAVAAFGWEAEPALVAALRHQVVEGWVAELIRRAIMLTAPSCSLFRPPLLAERDTHVCSADNHQRDT
jgi:hypothetical protein